MKNFLKITLGCAILAMLVALTSYRPASAEAKAIDVYEDTFNVDLDGNGKEEEISTRIEYNLDEFVYSIDVKINGKKAFSETLENNEFIDQANIGFIDINPKDKYIELLIEVAGESSCAQRVYRYKKKKLKLLFDTDWMGYLEGVEPEQEKGKNVLLCEQVTTPIGNYFYVITNNKIKKKKLKEITPKDGIYTVVEDSWGGRNYIYYLAKDADIYTKPDGKKVKLTLEEGTGFYITQLKKIKGEFAYALVSLDGGENEIGWLDLTGVSFEDMLVTNPSFAG
ncbi:MAG: hypothetical protein K6E47_16015 [Lachnospiraceae bacterium]|nr:hypothetical protein [Lachnospiraceae bacterium]